LHDIADLIPPLDRRRAAKRYGADRDLAGIGFEQPVNRSAKVVLPAPVGPLTPRNVPGAMVRLRRSIPAPARLDRS
jgi:hypothetical protein